MWFHVSEPNTYLVITGAAVKDVKICKKAFVYPFQKVTTISVTPFDFSMSLQAMTSEKLQFSLPAVFTIGPLDRQDSLKKYATLLSGDQDGVIQAGKAAKGTVATGRAHVQEIVRGVIEGETRSIVSNMTMEELFAGRKLFKQQVIECVQKELDQFGLWIYNANVKELQDTGDSNYFKSLAMRAKEGAVSRATVDVANARMIGEVGKAEREGETKQKIAKINATTAVLETDRKVEKANADQILRTREIAIARELDLEQISATRAAEQRDAELQKIVEQKRAEMELEKLRAEKVVAAQIAQESAQRKADADLYSSKTATDGSRYKSMAEAEAIAYRSNQDSDAKLYKQVKEAEALLATVEKQSEAKEREAQAAFIAQQKEAAGLTEMAKAYGALGNVLGGPQGLMQYLMLQNNVYEKLADANARAINGLQPKINVWNTGAQGDGVADPSAPIRNLFQALPPLLGTIQDQTGMMPPSWLAQMPKGEEHRNGEMTVEEKAAAKQRAIRGEQ